MSTIKVNSIKNTATNDGGIAIDNSGHVQMDGQQLPSAGALSNRNLVIGGAMNIAQRGTDPVTASGAFPVDRFKTSYNVTGGGFSAQQSTDAPEGFKNSVKFTVTTAASAGSAEVSSFFTALEGQDVQQADLGLSTSKPLTLSFYVKSSLTGTYSVAMRNSDGSRSYIAEYSISSANTWEEKTVTFPAITSGTWATDNTTGLSLTWDLGSGSDRQGTAGQWLSDTNDFASTNNVNWCNTASATWFITGVQLEPGGVATSFEHRSYGDELFRCQRYCYRIQGDTVDARVVGMGLARSSSNIRCVVPLPTTMRANEQVVTENNLAAMFRTSNTTVSMTSSQNEGKNAVCLTLAADSGTPFTAGDSVILRAANNTSAFFQVESEI